MPCLPIRLSQRKRSCWRCWVYVALLLSRAKDNDLLRFKKQRRAYGHDEIGEESRQSFQQMEQMDRSQFVRVVVIMAFPRAANEPAAVTVIALLHALGPLFAYKVALIIITFPVPAGGSASGAGRASA